MTDSPALTLFDMNDGPPLPPHSAGAVMTPVPGDQPPVSEVTTLSLAPAPRTVPTTSPAPAPVIVTSRGQKTALEILDMALATQARAIRTVTWHPRNDRLWVVRDGGTYRMTVQRGREEYFLTDVALRQLGGILGVPQPLLERLSGLQRAEDCRLINLLLWDEGGKPEAQVQAEIQGDHLVALRTGHFVRLDLSALAAKLGQSEAQGKLRVQHVEFGAGGIRLEIEHLGIPPFDLRPHSNKDGRPDLWRAGTIIVNMEDGTRAITVVPALLRAQGGLAMPVISGRTDVRKRRHSNVESDALVRAVVGDVAATREAEFGHAAERLRGLHDKFLRQGGVLGELEGLGWPFSSIHGRDTVVRTLTTGRPTVFRLATAGLRVARENVDAGKRLALETAIAKTVWSRGGAKGVKDSGDGSRKVPAKGRTGSGKTDEAAALPTQPRAGGADTSNKTSSATHPYARPRDPRIPARPTE